MERNYSEMSDEAIVEEWFKMLGDAEMRAYGNHSEFYGRLQLAVKSSDRAVVEGWFSRLNEAELRDLRDKNPGFYDTLTEKLR